MLRFSFSSSFLIRLAGNVLIQTFQRAHLVLYIFKFNGRNCSYFHLITFFFLNSYSFFSVAINEQNVRSAHDHRFNDCIISRISVLMNSCGHTIDPEL